MLSNNSLFSIYFVINFHTVWHLSLLTQIERKTCPSSLINSKPRRHQNLFMACRLMLKFLLLIKAFGVQCMKALKEKSMLMKINLFSNFPMCLQHRVKCFTKELLGKRQFSLKCTKHRGCALSNSGSFFEEKLKKERSLLHLDAGKMKNSLPHNNQNQFIVGSRAVLKAQNFPLRWIIQWVTKSGSFLSVRAIKKFHICSLVHVSVLVLVQKKNSFIVFPSRDVLRKRVVWTFINQSNLYGEKSLQVCVGGASKETNKAQEQKQSDTKCFIIKRDKKVWILD